MKLCDCQKQRMRSGVKGILAHVEGYQIKGSVYACEMCRIYSSDRQAAKVLRLALALNAILPAYCDHLRGVVARPADSELVQLAKDALAAVRA